MAIADYEHVEVDTRAGWRAWLVANHATRIGAWAVWFKKSSGRAMVAYEELVEEALCFGWVDGVAGTVDDAGTRQYFSPRKRGSGWAATNKARVARLIAEGLMTPVGLAVIEAAKADGSWSLLDASEAADMGDDLRAALGRHPMAADRLEAFPRGVRKNILQWIDLARTPATRAKRMEETARLAAENVRANQPKPKRKSMDVT